MAEGTVPRVLVAGASGFSGALAARLVWGHPRLELTAITSRNDAGRRLDELYPRHRVPLELEEPDLDAVGDVDAAIVAYPHGAAAPVAAELRERGALVIDLSADFRLSELDTYARWYGDHGAPELMGSAVYGLPELNRDAIREAKLIANPGCYPTAAILALAPLAEAGLIDGVVIDAKSGVSGAGRGGGEALHFSKVDENFKPYKVEGHRHDPEIGEQLAMLYPPASFASRQGAAAVSGQPPVTFVPHLLPIDQGLLASCYVTLARQTDAAELRELYRSRYADERFVEVVSDPPGVADVRETNFCRVYAGLDREGGRAMAFAAIDNLWKGASGQAIQNLNLMLGFDEAEGLG